MSMNPWSSFHLVRSLGGASVNILSAIAQPSSYQSSCRGKKASLKRSYSTEVTSFAPDSKLSAPPYFSMSLRKSCFLKSAIVGFGRLSQPLVPSGEDEFGVIGVCLFEHFC